MSTLDTPAPPPAPAPEAERHAGWLELFFDLVFVAFVAQLSRSLHGDPSWHDFGVFLALYFPPWWMWANLTVSANLFQDDSPRRRLAMLAAMLCLAVMAAAVPEATGDRGTAYALGYAGTRLVLLALWWPATRYPAPHALPRWRPLTYCLLFAVLWAGAAFVPAPWRYPVWAALLAAEMLLLLTARGRGVPARVHTGHLVERVGLFVIIVLGESVLGLITATDDTWTASAALVALLGFLLLAALWWSYFDFATTAAEINFASATPGQAYLLARDVGGFLHFFVTAAVISMAAGLSTAVGESGHDHLPRGAVWALAGGLALYHAAHGAIALRFGSSLARTATWALPGIAVPLLVVVVADALPPWAVVLLLAAEAVGHLVYAKRLARRALPPAAA
ncbi:low temperature requirement protein A [Streptomyces sp. NRRL S-87]|uniref:low temperature requirement protein A n=1 Tax=Streptomyces sp. NRRL S-87 TaxID=1463920 RepID=UPI00068C30A7|nr:low temperature requirement protein A [Streptomyces sp. NRRL S-87]